ncbi:hypothetical protein F5051DRAFT_237090 [Lentinula edodes]|nr:hypothetical protein F5051DRAFT_237090 [Lentinula edodes]
MSTSPISTRRRPGRDTESTTGRDDTHNVLATEPGLGGSRFKSGLGQFCPFFARGQCRYGDQCRWRHDAVAAIATAVSRSNSASLAASNAKIQTPSESKVQLQVKPCFAWRKGSCTKGDQCRYSHDPAEAVRSNLVSQSTADMTTISAPQNKGSINHRAKVIAKQEQERARERKRKADQERGKRLELARQREEAAQKKKEAELEAKHRAEEEALALEKFKIREQALLAEKHRSDALVTIQRNTFGSTIATFGAGAQIVWIVPGFQTCRVRIRDIPLGVQAVPFRDFLQTNLGDMGVDARQKFYVVSLKRWNQLQEAVVVADVDNAKDLVRRLDGVIFKGQSLKLDLNQNGGMGGMHTRNSGTFSLKISWKDPSSRYVVTYLSQITAEDQRRRFNGTLAFGRKIKVENNTNRHGDITPDQILISDLPFELTDGSVRNFFDGITVRRISGQSLGYAEDNVRPKLKEHIRWLCSVRSIEPPEFDEGRSQIHTTAVAVEHTVYARFDKWESAKQIHDLLKSQKFSWIGNAFFRLWLPDPIQYQITIPFRQYQAQLTRWKSFLSDAGGKKDLRMRINEKPDKEKVFVQVEGADAKALGMLKVRIENLAAGEKLGIWHRSFSTDSGRSFLRSLLSLTGVVVVPDWRLRVVKAYGEQPAIEKAREAILREIDRLAGLEYTVTLNRDSVRFFAQEGMTSLKERFGNDSVSLNISGLPRITIRGGEDAQRALHTLIEQSHRKVQPSKNEGGSSCPICLDEVSVPVQLGCGHEYCNACLHHFLTADVKNFPIVCLGDEAQCKKPIALPVIQKFLTEVQFDTLLEAAFMQHIEKNPEVFKYCPTPDCEQLYRCADSGLSESHVCCPSCLAEICTRCHEGHKGMSCDERQRSRNDQENNEELNARWAGMTGVKKCPRCSVWIEKTDGCNHISCRCGAHVCWRCMGIFDAGTIYAHMTNAHGGYGDGDGLIQNLDYDAQARELQVWNNLATARRIAQEPLQPLYHIDTGRNDRLVQEAQRRIALMHEQRRQQQEQRVRDLEATQRRTRQEEGGNWCTIM